MSKPVLKKRRKLEHNAIISEAESNSSTILQDVCICLTGLTASRKTEFHNLVKILGGSYRRDLVTQKTTHLIAEKPEGEKYIQAKKCSHIEIVTPKWLSMCAKQLQRVSEVQFRLMGGNKDADKKSSQPIQHDVGPSSLEIQVNQLLYKSKIPPNPLFSNLCFYLVGFPDTDLTNGNGLPSKKKNENSPLIPVLKRNLGTLIRRCTGTIFWEPNRNISHVIVNEECDIKTRNDVSNFCRYHPNNPMAISPEWIIECLQKKHLVLASDFPPRRKVTTPNVKKKASQTPVRNNVKHQIFSGLFFQILHPQENHISSANVSFKADKIEKMIEAHGGQILSREGIRVLQKGSSNMSTSNKIKHDERKCFLVHLSGPFHLEKIVQEDALLLHISQHDICKIIPVNAIWLQTCEASKTEIDPFQHEALFVPQSLPFRRLKNGIKLKVAVTGFMGAQRLALRFTLEAIGADYTENMGKDNTHLICKGATGPKFLKAVEWRLHVVTEDWLYHIVRFGHETDCERSYSLVETEDAGNSQETTVLSSQDY